MNYYEHHIGDYLADASHLSLLEHGCYLRLLHVYYRDEAPIPAADAARKIGARTEEERAAAASVLGEFFALDGDVWRHARCDREIERYQSKQASARASAAARWTKPAKASPNEPAKPTQCERNANALPTHTEGNAHQTPDTRHQTPEKTYGADAPAVFAQASPAIVCRALKDAGVASVAPSDQRLRTLVAAGADVAEFLAFVDKAKTAAPGREFAYVLGAVEGERKRAKAMAGELHRGEMPTVETPSARQARETAEAFSGSLVSAKRPRGTAPTMEVIDV